MAKGWCDFLIVGGGSAGCVLANRLSEESDIEVLLLEAGGRDWSPYLQVPAGRMRMSARYDWDYPAEPDPSRYDRVESWESGKVLGGSSAINGMLWARGSPEDFDDWAAAGCTGWDYQSVLPYFRRSETFVGSTSELRGRSGPQRVDVLHVEHELTDTFVAAAVRSGYRFNEDYNGESLDGVAIGQVTQRRGLRHSAARAFLAPVRRRRNLEVRTGAFVRRILFSGTKAVGVEYERHGRIEVAYAEREVILAAGALASPKILMLSGIGDAEALAKLDIPALVDLPGVGRDLQNHLYCTLVYEVDVPTLNREFTPANVLRGGFNLLAHGSGTATSAFGHVVVFDSVGGGRTDVQAIFAPYGLFAARENGRARHKMTLMPTNAITVRVGHMRPRSRGEVRLRSADPRLPPVITYAFAAHREDLSELATACRRMRAVLAAEPMGHHLRGELSPGSMVKDDAAFEEVFRRTCGSGKHPAGSCKMGAGDGAVVDPELRVCGTQALRVIDLSITPRITSANTNAAAIMIGERGADLVLGKSAAASR